MIPQNTTQENGQMVKFFIKSFTPNYVIHLTNKNKITNFDERLIQDFPTLIWEAEEYIDLDAVKLILKNRSYSSEFW